MTSVNGDKRRQILVVGLHAECTTKLSLRRTVAFAFSPNKARNMVHRARQTIASAKLMLGHVSIMNHSLVSVRESLKFEAWPVDSVWIAHSGTPSQSDTPKSIVQSMC